ncbi:glycosyltransferase family 4 protein [Jannaschia aquimarina]|uniref:KanE_1 protein n=1 Tax=Jannaschia aquimarina TaxID=935700 RepID=A0A0D1ENA6_9RHOB|nr:glycosyltransferase family 4 protein [Jannaschia aquimarina]KIT17170.1 Alpha-D-kanosaminyltransferase [Jannaschia aquimarina]SNT17732.1 Glycosyltransferase involved in cell wall bisynthesis [Jannaschia aquimarina]
MKVLLINDYGTPNGGAELQMLAIRRDLMARGHEVRLFASDATLVHGYPNAADRTAKGRTDLGQVLTQAVNPWAWAALRRELADHPPDMVHIRMFLWQLSPVILPLLRNVPVLYHAAVHKAVCPTGLKLLPDGTSCPHRPGRVCYREGCTAPITWTATMTQLALLRRWRSCIDQLAVLSEPMRAAFEAEGWTDVAVEGNGIDLVALRGPLTDPPVVVYGGRLAREKGVETLLDAFSRLRDRHPTARLLIAGTGPSEPALRQRAAPMGDAVAFLGHLSRERMEEVFATAWVQVVPSLWHEPFGNVSTEAMARGTAVIASDMGGQRTIVADGETGFLVPPGDVRALSDRLDRILGDRDLAERLGRAGRHRAETVFSRARVMDRIEALYDRTIARHGAGKAVLA